MTPPFDGLSSKLYTIRPIWKIDLHLYIIIIHLNSNVCQRNRGVFRLLEKRKKGPVFVHFAVAVLFKPHPLLRSTLSAFGEGLTGFSKGGEAVAAGD